MALVSVRAACAIAITRGPGAHAAPHTLTGCLAREKIAKSLSRRAGPAIAAQWRPALCCVDEEMKGVRSGGADKPTGKKTQRERDRQKGRERERERERESQEQVLQQGQQEAVGSAHMQGVRKYLRGVQTDRHTQTDTRTHRHHRHTDTETYTDTDTQRHTHTQTHRHTARAHRL
jgi:hypothetical protein